MRSRTLIAVLRGLSALSLLSFVACSEVVDPLVSDEAVNSVFAIGDHPKTVVAALAMNQLNHEETEDYSWNASDETSIILTGDSITSPGRGVVVNGARAVITAAGNYRISGSLTDGQLVVNTEDKGIVRLILHGVNLTCSTSAPIYIAKAKKVVIILADASTNSVADGAGYVFADPELDEPNACIYSTTDLSLGGNGSLTVAGHYNDGIASKDGLLIAGGSIAVTTKDDGLRGKDYLVVKNGALTVTSGGDGLKSDNDEDPTRGYVWINNGSITVTSGGDAVSASTDVLISNGQLNLISGGGSGKSPSDAVSSKAIKGLVNTIVDQGTLTISSADDALHANSNLVINDGALFISSGDDGIHADSTLMINGGTIRITKCYEGIESMNIAINGGEIHVTAGDDGLNGAGGVDGSGMGGRPGGMPAGDYYLYINGGYIYLNTTGDGVDVNGAIIMTGGKLVVNGPTSNNNGALDYDRAFKMTGGTLIAAGSSGMVQAPGAASTQCAVLMTFRSMLKGGTLFHIQNSSGGEVLSFTPLKNYQSAVFSSPTLQKGSTYDVYYGGTSTGTAQDGLYSGGVYTAGTKLAGITLSDIITRVSL
ncbi:MAG TPA: carbohydrate-binding domain-containing protein [bacterium]|nr:carbohydrate-binding domain-containing protein [bacterium]